VHIVKVRRHGVESDISLPDDIDDLADRIRGVQPSLLIVDPLIAHLPLKIDSHKAQHVRQALAPLAHLAETEHLAVVAVVHFNGAASTDVRTRISGSKALRDASRSVIVCGADPEDPSRFVMVQDKNSFGPRPTTGQRYEIIPASIEHGGTSFATSKVRWRGQIEIDAHRLLAGRPTERPTPKTDAAAEMLRDLLGAGPRKQADIRTEAERRGISWRTVESTKARLPIDVYQRPEPGRRGPGPSWWCLRNGPQQGNGPQSASCGPFKASPTSDDENHHSQADLVRGEVADHTPQNVPRCGRCSKVSLLDPCRSCATPEEAAYYPTKQR
jgi:hypothetical protein